MPDNRPFKFSTDHFSGVTVDEASKTVPGQCPLARRISVEIAKAGPARILGNAAQSIPNQSLAVFAPLIPGCVGAVNAEQQDRSAK